MAVAAGGDARRGGAGAPLRRLPGHQPGRASADGAGGGRAPGGGRGGAPALGAAAELAAGEERRAAAPSAGLGGRAGGGLLGGRARGPDRRSAAALPGGRRQAGRGLGPGDQAPGAGGVRAQRPLVRGGDLRQCRPPAGRLPRTLDGDVHRGLRGDQRPRRAVGRGPRPADGLPRRPAGRGEGADADLCPCRRPGRRQCGRRGQRARNAGALRRRAPAAQPAAAPR